MAMAKKITTSGKMDVAPRKSVTKTTVKTAVRNSPIPKPTAATAAKRVEISSEQIARRAFEIYASGKGGSEVDNWFQAERELRAGV